MLKIKGSSFAGGYETNRLRSKYVLCRIVPIGMELRDAKKGGERLFPKHFRNVRISSDRACFQETRLLSSKESCSG